MTIPETSYHGHEYYTVFYLLGFAVAGVLLLRAGYQRRYPWRPWLLLIAGTLLCFILGTKLIAGSPADWRALWETGSWRPGAARSVLGGLLGAIVGLELLRRILGFSDRRVFDAFALPFAIGLAIQGVGCVLAGCCFGTLGGGAAGLAYGPHTAPFAWQVARGWISADASQALPVVPVQAAQILLCLLIGGGLVWLQQRHRLTRPGSHWLLALGLFAAGRFGLEFWRDPAGDVVGSATWLGLKQVQWALALTTLAVLGSLRWLYRPAAQPRRPAGPTAPEQPLVNLTVLAALLALTASPAAQWLTGAEVAVIKCLLAPVLLLEAARLITSARLGTLLTQPAAVALLLLATGLMSVAPSPPPAPTDTIAAARRGTTTLLVDGSLGRAYHLFQSPSSCNPTYPNVLTVPGYRQNTAVGGLGLERSVPVGESNEFVFGARFYAGRSASRGTEYFQVRRYDTTTNNYPIYRYVDSTSTYAVRRRIYAFSPYLEYRLHWPNNTTVRFRGGGHFGVVGYDIFASTQARRATPEVLFEVSKARRLVVHASINQGIYGLGNGSWRAGLGWNFLQDRLQVIAGPAQTNANGHTEYGINLLGSSKNFHSPQEWFSQASLRLDPRWQLDVSGLSNFNDVRQIAFSTRYVLSRPKR